MVGAGVAEVVAAGGVDGVETDADAATGVVETGEPPTGWATGPGATDGCGFAVTDGFAVGAVDVCADATGSAATPVPARLTAGWSIRLGDSAEVASATGPLCAGTAGPAEATDGPPPTGPSPDGSPPAGPPPSGVGSAGSVGGTDRLPGVPDSASSRPAFNRCVLCEVSPLRAPEVAARAASSRSGIPLPVASDAAVSPSTSPPTSRTSPSPNRPPREVACRPSPASDAPAPPANPPSADIPSDRASSPSRRPVVFW